MNQYIEFRNRFLKANGYYSSDEIIKMAENTPFQIDDPFTKIKKGTVIRPNAKILCNTIVDGSEVVVGEESILSEAKISGNKIILGKRNTITGKIEPDNIVFGDDNKISNINGFNKGNTIVIGNSNIFDNVKFAISGHPSNNQNQTQIRIHDQNKFYSGTNLNIPFNEGRIWIGSKNELGRDGGGVISSSYRFDKKQDGILLIGSNVETTRGAELMGWSAIGFDKSLFLKYLNLSEQNFDGLFLNGNLIQLNDLFLKIIFEMEKNAYLAQDDTSNIKKIKVGMFGVSKIRRCFLGGFVKFKDDNRTLCCVLENVDIAERNNIYYSTIKGNLDKIIKIKVQGKYIEKASINPENLNIETDRFGENPITDYPVTDNDFYNNLS